MTVHVTIIAPTDAEKELAAHEGAFSARKVEIDGRKLTVIIFGDGPTEYMNRVERAIDAMQIASFNDDGSIVIRPVDAMPVRVGGCPEAFRGG